MQIKTNEGIIDVHDLERVGRGGTYNVYALDNERVLKVSYKGNQVRNPAEVLEALQGVIMTPKVYEYDEQWYIMERIHGYTAFEIIDRRIETIPFDHEDYKKQIKEYFLSSFERGWEPVDLYARNVMLDFNGGIWIVDHDCFFNHLPKETEIQLKQMEEESKGNRALQAYLRSFRKRQVPQLKENDSRLKEILEVGEELNEVINNGVTV